MFKTSLITNANITCSAESSQFVNSANYKISKSNDKAIKCFVFKNIIGYVHGNNFNKFQWYTIKKKKNCFCMNLYLLRSLKW